MVELKMNIATIIECAKSLEMVVDGNEYLDEYYVRMLLSNTRGIIEELHRCKDIVTVHNTIDEIVK